MPISRRLLQCSLVCLLTWSSGWAAEPGPHNPRNQLGQSSSPYLLQHAGNPVDWHPWGPEAFAKAKADNKLIFLSIGYFACHWCHVMERESFQNADIAAFLNKHFVCIKVDREERPDIDHAYMTALQVMGQNGGWPLSMFLTATGQPIAGGTYWPPENREVDGETLPGFRTILEAVIAAWQNQPEQIQQTAELRAGQTRRALLLNLGLPQSVHLSDDLFVRGVRQVSQLYDAQFGGFGRPPQFIGPKFPQPAYLQLLLMESSSASRAVVDTTLERMARSGLYDQLGGGFHRYSTERTWTVPHFEKMLYDNAQLVEIYATACESQPSPLYQRVVEETLEFLNLELSSPAGGFYAAIDAETEGVEGRFYVWTTEQLAEIFPKAEDLTLAKRLWGLDGLPNFEETAWVLTSPSQADVSAAQRDDLRRRLLTARAQRSRPAVDTKVLTAWNGLAIAAFAQSGRVFHRPENLDRAAQAAEFLLQNLRAADGRLFHQYAAAPGAQPRAEIAGFLDDYTHSVHGLLTLHAATGQERWLKAAQSITASMIEQFYDAEQGGFFYSAPDHETLFVRTKDQYDGVLLSGNSQAVLNLLILAERTGDQRYRELAENTLKMFASSLEQHPTSLTGMLRGLHVFLQPDK